MASASQRVTEWMVETSYHELCKYLFVFYGEEIKIDALIHLYILVTGIEKTEPTKLSFFEKLKEVHSLMIKYPFKIHSRLQSAGMDNLALIAEYIDESPKTWFTKRSSYKVWSLLVGYSSYVFVHPLIQKFTFIAMGSALLVVGIQMFIIKRQLNPPAILTWPKPILGKFHLALFFFNQKLIFF
jgi:hypothetical protein